MIFILKDYLPRAWDVTPDNPNWETQAWKSSTGKKITYWHAACLLNMAGKPESTTKPFAAACYNKEVFQLKR